MAASSFVNLTDFVREKLINTAGSNYSIPVYLEELPPKATKDFILVEGDISEYNSQMLNCSEWDIQIKTQSNVSKERAKDYSIYCVRLFGDIVDLTLTLDSINIRVVKSKAYAPLLYLGEARNGFFQYSNRFRMLIQNLGI